MFDIIRSSKRHTKINCEISSMLNHIELWKYWMAPPTSVCPMKTEYIVDVFYYCFLANTLRQDV